MNKAEQISRISDITEVPKTVVSNVYSALTSVITTCLEDGEEVSIPGIGKFQVVEAKGRVVSNPTTGEKIEVPEHNKIRFRPSSSLKKAINGEC